MANPFYIEPANPLKALMAFDQSYQGARKRTQEDEKKAALQQFAQANPQLGPIAQLIGVDVPAAQALSNMDLARSNQAFRQQEAIRQQQNADRSFGLQQDQFRHQQQQAQRPDIQMYDTGEGGPKVPIAIDRSGPTPTATPLQIPGIATASTNPFAQGPATEGQSNARLYANRLFAAEKVLRDPETIKEQTNIRQQGFKQVPGVGNYLISGATQRGSQAERDFVNAVLRRESGATIQPSEFASAEQQYFPRPGDTPEVIKQKQRNRTEAIKGIAGAGGRSYRPPATFGTDGEMIPAGEGSMVGTRGETIVGSGEWQTLPNGVKIREIK